MILCIPLPMPLPAPATSARFPEKSSSISGKLSKLQGRDLCFSRDRDYMVTPCTCKCTKTLPDLFSRHKHVS